MKEPAMINGTDLRFMVWRHLDNYIGEFFETEEAAETFAKKECVGDPGGTFLVLEVKLMVTRRESVEAVISRFPSWEVKP